jgi:Cell morphogenesis N-terminal
MQSIHTRATSMVAKPRYGLAALPLVCAAISAAPQDIMLANWQTAVDLCFAKFKVCASPRFPSSTFLISLAGIVRRTNQFAQSPFIRC